MSLCSHFFGTPLREAINIDTKECIVNSMNGNSKKHFLMHNFFKVMHLCVSAIKRIIRRQKENNFHYEVL